MMQSLMRGQPEQSPPAGSTAGGALGSPPPFQGGGDYSRPPRKRWFKRLPLNGLLLCLLAAGAPTAAVVETYEFASEGLRARYQALVAELRCPKCENQNIADSNAPVSADLRAQVHRLLHEGRSDREIMDYMVERYGEFVLYRPRWSAVTAALWLAPLVLLLLAAAVLAVIFRPRRRSFPPSRRADGSPSAPAGRPRPDDAPPDA